MTETIELIQDAVWRAKAEDVTAPVWVVMPTGASARSTLDALARNGGVFNVRFFTFDHLADEIVQQQDGPSHLATAVKREIVRSVVAGARAPLDAYQPSVLLQSISEVFDDLCHRSPDEIVRIAEVSALSGELVRLYSEFRGRIAGLYSERTDRLAAATDFVLAGGEVPQVVAVVAEPPGAYETALLGALATALRLQVVALKTGDEELDSALAPWLWGLSPETVAPASLPVDTIAVAPDADAEVQIAIGELLRHAEEGVPFSRMALLYSARTPYASIVEDQFRQSGIPVRGGSASKLSQTFAGGFVTRLFDMIDSEFEYTSVAAWLLGTRRLNASDWLRVARRARVTGGPDVWGQRLRVFAGEQATRNPGGESGIEAVAFAEFLDELSDWLSLEAHTWRAWAEWLQAGLEKYLGSHGERKQWPDHEARSAVVVESRVARIAALDEISGEASRDVFMDALRAEFESHSGRGGNKGAFVGSVGDAIGCEFDVTIVVGMAEGLFPRPVEKGPLLAALMVPGEEARAERDTRAFKLRMNSGGFRMLTIPMADVRGQRPMRPSWLALSEASRLAGTVVSADELAQSRNEWPWLEVFSSFTQMIARPQLQSSALFDELGAISRAVGSGTDCTEMDWVADADTFRRGVDLLRHRDSDDFTRHDGLIGADIPLGGSESVPLRVTQLERWAQCPFRYFLESILDVEVDDDDAALLSMSPRHRGQIIHSILESFIRDVPDRVSPDQPWNEDERLTLHQIVDRHFAQAVRAGLAPDGFTTEVQRKALHRQLEVLLDDDERMRKALGVVPVAVEKTFGRDSATSVDVQGVSGAQVWFAGRIDRVDASIDGTRAVVTDYKTGKPDRNKSIKADPLAAGRSLQLMVYGKAVQRTFPAADVKSEYWYVTDESSQFKREGIQLDDALDDRVREVFGLIGESFSNGAFPAVPGEEDGRTSFQNCRTCPYDAVCPRDRAEAWARKSNADAVAPYVTLSDPSVRGSR